MMDAGLTWDVELFWDLDGMVGDGLSTDPETQCFTDLYDDKCRLPTISLAHSVFLGGRVSVWHL